MTHPFSNPTLPLDNWTVPPKGSLKWCLWSQDKPLDAALEMGDPGSGRDAMSLGSKSTPREGHRLPTLSAKGQLGQGPSPPPTVKEEGTAGRDQWGKNGGPSPCTVSAFHFRYAGGWSATCRMLS